MLLDQNGQPISDSLETRVDKVEATIGDIILHLRQITPVVEQSHSFLRTLQSQNLDLSWLLEFIINHNELKFDEDKFIEFRKNKIMELQALQAQKLKEMEKIHQEKTESDIDLNE